MSPRRLPRMLLFAAAGAAWCAAAGILAVAVGRTIAHADRRDYVPQVDVPLWRGTDLPQPKIAPAQSGDVLDDLWWSWQPRPPSEPDPFSPTNRRDPRDPDAWPLPLPHLWTFPDRPTEEHP